MKKVLITGIAGFIGHGVAKKLLSSGYKIVGLDNLSDYYDVNLKKSRIENLQKFGTFDFEVIDLIDTTHLKKLFEKHNFGQVIHLAAQAGVRYSLENPQAYVNSNIVGFTNILENCRHYNIEHLIYASSSSVYGANGKQPFSVHDSTEHPLSFYAATKKANESMAHAYSHLYNLPTTGLRFFTVYGPWGRPDMSLFKFTQALLNNEPIDLYNQGKHQRDFTYIDDIVEGIYQLLFHIPTGNPNWSGAAPDPGTSQAPWTLYNIGSHRPIDLLDMIDCLEKTIGKKAQYNFLPMQPGDVIGTFADISDLFNTINYKPKTSLESGVKAFVDWYLEFYSIKELVH